MQRAEEGLCQHPARYGLHHSCYSLRTASHEWSPYIYLVEGETKENPNDAFHHNCSHNADPKRLARESEGLLLASFGWVIHIQ